MQIVIPMAGSGQRFLDAGYTDPKPLINFDGEPIIKRIINIFPNENNFIFICNDDHLQNTNIAEVIKTILPSARIFGVSPHKKGPVYSVSKIFDHIDAKEEVIIQYCDVSKYWDYSDFLKHTRDRKADGAISCNLGFHPHMLTGNCYALIDAEQQWLKKITEKKPIEDIDKEYVSDGAYYFRTGQLLKKYFQKTIDLDIHINGEYYASVVYNLMKDDNLRISIYEIQHMLSMQTPNDLEEFNRWSNYFRVITDKKTTLAPEINSINLIPLAGRGKRFVDRGYKTPKPLIKVDGKPMVIRSTESLPPARKQIFVCLKEHLNKYPLKEAIMDKYKHAKVVSLDRLTEGQACTINEGLKGEDLDSPIMIGACDFSAVWNEAKYKKLLADNSVDAIVWSFRHHPYSKIHPEMYGWVKTDRRGNVKGISVKAPISDDPFNDHAFSGSMYFRKVRYFKDALKSLIKNKNTINGEYYLDSCINELINVGLKVKIFEVDHYISWNTPDELKTYEYWQSCFHKADWHSYSLFSDPYIEPKEAKLLDKKYRTFTQKYR